MENSAVAKLKDVILTTLKSFQPNIFTNDCLKIIIKYGCDGCTGGYDYKLRKFEAEKDDNSLLILSICFLKIYCGDTLIFENKNPTSPYFCRPIYLYTRKETPDFLRMVFQKFQEELFDLKSYVKTIRYKLLTISLIGLPAMSSMAAASCKNDLWRT